MLFETNMILILVVNHMDQSFEIQYLKHCCVNNNAQCLYICPTHLKLVTCTFILVLQIVKLEDKCIFHYFFQQIQLKKKMNTDFTLSRFSNEVSFFLVVQCVLRVCTSKSKPAIIVHLHYNIEKHYRKYLSMLSFPCFFFLNFIIISFYV